MDDAVYTFEQLLQQSLDVQGEDDMCKSIQRCQDRVLKVNWKTLWRETEVEQNV